MLQFELADNKLVDFFTFLRVDIGTKVTEKNSKIDDGRPGS
jgi:hypothetical protein